MTPRLVVAAMIRNEASRFLASALNTWKEFSDEVIVLDDASDDGSRAICARAGVTTFDAVGEEMAWGREAPKRRQLWERALDATDEGDYILILDADMTPARSPRWFMETEADAIAFPLYDIWRVEDDPRRLWYRDEGAWRAHLAPRVWMLRRPADVEWAWNARGVHCGHLPENVTFGRVLFAPADYGLLHYAYATEALRRAKHAAYVALSQQLTSFEREHAASILDERVHLAQLPFTPEFTLTCASS